VILLTWLASPALAGDEEYKLGPDNRPDEQ